MKLEIENMTSEQIEEKIEEISSQIDSLYDLRDEYTSELRKRDDAKVQVTNDCLKLGNDVHVVAIAKHLDYHLSLIKVFTGLKVNNSDIDFTLHDYRVDDYEYSYRVSKQSQYKTVFHNLIGEYDLYATDSPSTISAILKKCSTIDAHIGN